ncbi:MAG TPA: DUF4294 domain-containing protein [Flavobacterium sp.]|jgi:hypothetical protein
MNIKCLFLFLLLSLTSAAQEIKKDSTDTEEIDTLSMDPILLQEVVINNSKLDAEARKQFLILQNRVYKTYPYAKIASERLTALDRNMSKLKTDKERKKYFKIVENYIENEFTDRLKKLSRKQGQILVKLIYRQTGSSAFDLVKDYKSGWKAFWASNTAKVFDINLKSKYAPYDVNEDYLIETILIRAFESGRLPRQQSANPVDYEKLNAYWQEKAAK